MCSAYGCECVSVLPFEVNSGYVEDDTFKPQDHKESLREGTVTDAFPITSSLYTYTHAKTYKKISSP